MYAKYISQGVAWNRTWVGSLSCSHKTLTGVFEHFGARIPKISNYVSPQWMVHFASRKKICNRQETESLSLK